MKIAVACSWSTKKENRTEVDVSIQSFAKPRPVNEYFVIRNIAI